MISVCIATYNGEKYIREQLDSILTQISVNDEIIISDDNSTDRTIDVIQKFNDPRIKIFYNSGEPGYTSNFENALVHSNGDIIFLADQDDIWYSGKVQRTLKALKNADLVACDATVIDENRNILYPSYFEQRIVYSSWLGNFFRFGYLGCCQAFKRSVLKRALPFPKDHIKCTHDNWIFMIAKTFGKVEIINKSLIMYRRHSNTASDGGKNEHKPWKFRISYRMYLLWQLSKRMKSKKN